MARRPRPRPPTPCEIAEAEVLMELRIIHDLVGDEDYGNMPLKEVWDLLTDKGKEALNRSVVEGRKELRTHQDKTIDWMIRDYRKKVAAGKEVRYPEMYEELIREREARQP